MALARAHLRGAQLLILDERTAALHARSEHEVFERVARRLGLAQAHEQLAKLKGVQSG